MALVRLDKPAHAVRLDRKPGLGRAQGDDAVRVCDRIVSLPGNDRLVRGGINSCVEKDLQPLCLGNNLFISTTHEPALYTIRTISTTLLIIPPGPAFRSIISSVNQNGTRRPSPGPTQVCVSFPERAASFALNVVEDMLMRSQMRSFMNFVYGWPE